MVKKKANVDADADADAEVEVEATPTKVLQLVPSLQSKPPERLLKLLASDLFKKMNKQAGGVAIALASERNLRVPRIPSGIFQLDCALGGGWQVGMIHTMYGPQSGSKTTNVLRAIAEAQKLCGDCWTGDYQTLKCECGSFRPTVIAFIDVEGTLDLEWAIKIGVDLERMVVSRPEFAEQSLDYLEALLRTGDVDVIALDSLAFLTPAKEIEEGMSKETMGLQPRVIGRGMRKVVAALNHMEMISVKRRPTIFFTNQIRMAIGVMFGNPETVSGGKAPRFAATTEVRLSPGKYEIPEAKDGGIGKPSSVEMRFKIEKNKSAVAKIEGEYVMALSPFENKSLGQILDESEIVRKAEQLGLLKGHGAVWTFLDEKFTKGKAEIEHRLMYDPAYKHIAAKYVMDVYLKV